MTLPHTVKRIRLTIARSKDFPSGPTHQGYELIAPGEYVTIRDKEHAFQVASVASAGQ